jgi:hypothetical protein
MSACPWHRSHLAQTFSVAENPRSSGSWVRTEGLSVRPHRLHSIQARISASISVLILVASSPALVARSKPHFEWVLAQMRT